MDHNETKTRPLQIACCWLIVLVPLGWGVLQSVAKSLPLFQHQQKAPAVGSDHHGGRSR